MRTLSRVGQYSRKLLIHKVGGRPLFDANIFLERIAPHWLPLAGLNLWVPNPDFVRPPDVDSFEWIDLVLCKTRHAVELFTSLGLPVRYMGFTSTDCRQKAVRRSAIERKEFSQCLHISSGWLKGTDAVVDLWRSHPEWPTLVLLDPARDPVRLPNVVHLSDRLSTERLRRVQSESAVHLCPSETEGWGHTIGEALSCGALVVTTDAPNE